MSEDFKFSESGVEGTMRVSPTGFGHVFVGGVATYKGCSYNFRFDMDASKGWVDWPSAYGNYAKASFGQKKAYDTPIPVTYFEPFKAAVLKVAKESGKWSELIEVMTTGEVLASRLHQALKKVEEADAARAEAVASWERIQAECAAYSVKMDEVMGK